MNRIASILPAAKRWGGGPPDPQGLVVEGPSRTLPLHHAACGVMVPLPKRGLGRILVALLASSVLFSCTQASVNNAEAAHPTIVSLNPCSDAVLAEVADPGQLLAISRYSHDPASSSMDLARARQFPAVSGSAEEVLALAPDIVIADAFVPVATRAAFAELGIELVSIPIAGSVAESKAQVMQLARLAGQPERGRALNRRIDAALAKAAASKNQPSVDAIVWQAGGIVPGQETLVADLLNRTGFRLAKAAQGLGQADYLPLEAVLADPPQVILAAGHPRAAENRLHSHPVLGALDGTRRAAFDPSLLWCGGTTIVRAAERLAEVRSSFETGLRMRSALPQDDRKKNPVRPEEKTRLETEASSRRAER